MIVRACFLSKIIRNKQNTLLSRYVLLSKCYIARLRTFGLWFYAWILLKFQVWKWRCVNFLHCSSWGLLIKVWQQNCIVVLTATIGLSKWLFCWENSLIIYIFWHRTIYVVEDVKPTVSLIQHWGLAPNWTGLSLLSSWLSPGEFRSRSPVIQTPTLARFSSLL